MDKQNENLEEILLEAEMNYYANTTEFEEVSEYLSYYSSVVPGDVVKLNEEWYEVERAELITHPTDSYYVGVKITSTTGEVFNLDTSAIIKSNLLTKRVKRCEYSKNIKVGDIIFTGYLKVMVDSIYLQEGGNGRMARVFICHTLNRETQSAYYIVSDSSGMTPYNIAVEK